MDQTKNETFAELLRRCCAFQIFYPGQVPLVDGVPVQTKLFRVVLLRSGNESNDLDVAYRELLSQLHHEFDTVLHAAQAQRILTPPSVAAVNAVLALPERFDTALCGVDFFKTLLTCDLHDIYAPVEKHAAFSAGRLGVLTPYSPNELDLDRRIELFTDAMLWDDLKFLHPVETYLYRRSNLTFVQEGDVPALTLTPTTIMLQLRAGFALNQPLALWQLLER